MSEIIGYYFNIDQPLDEFAKRLNNILGCSLAVIEADQSDYYCRFLAMEFSLGHCNFKNDRDLNFEDYNCFLDFRIPSPDNDLIALAVPSMISVAYVLHHRLGIQEGLLVWDMQTVIAKYGLKQNDMGQYQWYDFISGQFTHNHTHWVNAQTT